MRVSFKINMLQNSRYRKHLRHNVRWTVNPQRSCDPTKSTMQPTYLELITFHQRRLSEGNGVPSDAHTPPTQSVRNQLSTLHSYLSFCGKTAESRVGRELTSQFDAHLRSYIESLPVTTHTKSDRRSHLRSWRDSANDMLSPVASRNEVKETDGTALSPFHLLLRQAIAAADEKPKTLARRCGASTSAIQRWLKGAFPNTRARPSLHRLEAVLRLAPNSLTELAFSKQRTERASIDAGPSIPYRDRLRQNVLSPYLLHETKLTTQFLLEWASFFEYKTTRRPRLNRSSEGVWRMLPPESIGKRLSALAFRNGLGASSADLTLDKLRGFFGYVRPCVSAMPFSYPCWSQILYAYVTSSS